MMKKKLNYFVAGLSLLLLFSGAIAYASSVLATWLDGNRNTATGTSSARTNMGASSFVGPGHRFQTRTRGPGDLATGWITVTVHSPSQIVQSPWLTIGTNHTITFTGNFEFARPTAPQNWIVLPSRTITITVP